MLPGKQRVSRWNNINFPNKQGKFFEKVKKRVQVNIRSSSKLQAKSNTQTTTSQIFSVIAAVWRVAGSTNLTKSPAGDAYLVDLGSGLKSFDFTWKFREKVLTSNSPFSTTIDAMMEFLGVLKSWRSDAFVVVKENFSSFQKIPVWTLNHHACSEIYWTTMLLHGWGWFMRKMAPILTGSHNKPRCTKSLTTLKISVPYSNYF